LPKSCLNVDLPSPRWGDAVAFGPSLPSMGGCRCLRTFPPPDGGMPLPLDLPSPRWGMPLPLDLPSPRRGLPWPSELASPLRARRPVHGSTELPAAILVVLMAHPERFVEVAPGTWVRRDDGPEAGVPARPFRPPLAGGAAAAVAPPEAQTDVEAISAPAG